MYTSYTKPNTKDIMVEKAIELFKERGTEAVSLKDICDRAAVTRNAFYYHFESKDLLFDSVGDWVSRISKERIQMIYEPDSYYQQFWEYYRAYILTEIEMGADIMNRICFSRTMKGRTDYYSYIDDKLALQMTALIRRAQEEKIVRNSGSPEDLLWTSYDIVRGVNIKWCFQWGTSDILSETKRGLDTLFMPSEGHALK